MSTDIPRHRIHPDDDYISQTKHANSILTMRSKVPAGDTPLSDAIKTMRQFCVSASEWGEEHLTRFQTVVLESSLFGNMFPIEYVPQLDDPVVMALQRDHFFNTTEEEVKRGEWKSKTYHNYFFLDLMHLLVGAEAPILVTPSTRVVHECVAKTSARLSIERLLAEEDFARPESPIMDGTTSPMSIFFADTTATKSLRFWGPRETGTHSLFHNMLKALACLEYDHGDQTETYWLPA